MNSIGTTLRFSSRTCQRLQTGLLMLALVFTLSACTGNDYFGSERPQYSQDGFQLLVGGDVTRSSTNDQILDGMRLYCFDRTAVGGVEPEQGSTSNPKPVGSGSLLSPYHHVLQGLVRDGNTLKSSQMRIGKWDMVMVSGQGATLNLPYVATTAGKALMYTFDPADNQGQAHEFYHRFHRLPETTQSGRTAVLSAVSRNVAQVRITVDRAVDIDATALAGTHSVKVQNAPKHISWAGTLLKSVAGGYQTSTSDFDVVTPLEQSFTFIAGAEAGTYTSNTLTFVIPAHRSADFWNTDGQTQNRGILDTITKRLSLELSFARPSGRPAFTQTVEVQRVPRCNQILDVHIKMKDANVEISSDILDWDHQPVSGDVGAPYLNVSQLETEVYDSWETQLLFWSNQSVDKVYVEPMFSAGATGGNVNDVFWDLAAAGAFNCEYDTTTGMGRLYLSHQMEYEDSAPGNKEYKLRLHAGGLVREITIKSYVGGREATGPRTRAASSDDNSTPYVGTFHRATQRGERVITWQHTDEWNAKAEGDDNVLRELLIDRMASPSLAEGRLYGYDPGDAEKYMVSNGGNRLVYRGNVSLRVGWKSDGNPNTPRYAKIVVRAGRTVGAGNVIATLYVRQGEMADFLMPRDGSRPLANRISPYNLTAPTIGNGGEDVASHPLVGVGGGVFTKYPTQTGAYFDPQNTRAYHPWNPVGALTGVTQPPIGAWDADLMETCPAGYRRLYDSSAGTVAGSEFKQTLMLSPVDGHELQNLDNNSSFGYYADGFFDRRTIETPEFGSYATAPSVVAKGKDVAYCGVLIPSVNGNASVFFPFAGGRQFGDGAMIVPGGEGFIATSTFVNGENVQMVLWANGTLSVRQANHLCPIRCVTLNSVALTFNGNGSDGGVIPNDILASERSRVVIPDGQPTRLGYNFKGWTLNADGSGTVYFKDAALAGTEGHLVMPIGGATLYAQWIKTYALTFNGNGQTNGSVPAAITNKLSGDVVSVPGAGNLERTGYRFDSWNTQIDGNGTSYAPGSNFTFAAGDVTLYAKWVRAFTLSFYGNGATGGTIPANILLVAGQTGNIPVDIPSRDGYNFVGWCKKSDPTTVTQSDVIYTYLGGTNNYSNTIVLIEDTKLYALWAKTAGCAYIDMIGEGDNAMLIPAGGSSLMYFKYGSTVGLLDPYPNGKAYKPQWVGFNPTNTAVFAKLADIPFTAPPQNITAEWHRANVLNGRGDPCRLMGIPLSQIKAGNVDNGTWRLPTLIEIRSIANGATGPVLGRDYGQLAVEMTWGNQKLWFFSRTSLPGWSDEEFFRSPNTNYYSSNATNNNRVEVLEVRVDFTILTKKGLRVGNPIVPYTGQQAFCLRQ